MNYLDNLYDEMSRDSVNDSNGMAGLYNRYFRIRKRSIPRGEAFRRLESLEFAQRYKDFEEGL